MGHIISAAPTFYFQAPGDERRFKGTKAVMSGGATTLLTQTHSGLTNERLKVTELNEEAKSFFISSVPRTSLAVGLQWFKIASGIDFQKIPEEETGANSFNFHV